MTDSQSKFAPPLKMGNEAARQPLGPADRHGRSSREAIESGLRFLDTAWQDGCWPDSAASFAGIVRITACALARLAEIPSYYKNYSLQSKIEISLDWMTRMASPQGCWSSRPTTDDVNATAWAVLALRGHGRSVPDAALDFLRRCRRFDGAFASDPAAEHSQGKPSVAETTAVAVRALDHMDWVTENFLSTHLRSAASAVAGWRDSRFFVCSEILDWREGLAPAALLNQVRQLASGSGKESALEQARLLRCLVGLRMQRAWSLTAGLRATQRTDGSWPDHDGQKIIATATAVSALVLAESQPGLYFGSDLPLPRRLHQF